eukprot:COSAG06_NODE_1864_length_8194_cov_4.258431_4_plen_87_part_00
MFLLPQRQTAPPQPRHPRAWRLTAAAGAVDVASESDAQSGRRVSLMNEIGSTGWISQSPVDLGQRSAQQWPDRTTRPTQGSRLRRP